MERGKCMGEDLVKVAGEVEGGRGALQVCFLLSFFFYPHLRTCSLILEWGREREG